MEPKIATYRRNGTKNMPNEWGLGNQLPKDLDSSVVTNIQRM